MIAALVLAAALGDCVQPKPAQVAPHVHAKGPVSMHKRKRHSLLKPVETNCDEISTSIVEMFVIPPEVPPTYAEFTPVQEMVQTWPVDEPVTPAPVAQCECFGRFIGDSSQGNSSGGSSGGLSGGGLVVVFSPVAPVPEPGSWAMLLVGAAGLAWGRRS